MKIIGLHSQYRDHTPGVIAELLGHELEAIAGSGHGNSLSRVAPGQVVNISDRWRHLMDVESNVRAAKTLPQRLRALADVLEMNVPAIVAIAAQPPEDIVAAD